MKLFVELNLKGDCYWDYQGSVKKRKIIFHPNQTMKTRNFFSIFHFSTQHPCKQTHPESHVSFTHIFIQNKNTFL